MHPGSQISENQDLQDQFEIENLRKEKQEVGHSMAVKEKHNCRFLLLRYVPDAVKNEFVNVGLVLLPPDSPAEVRFTDDWSRVRALDPQADIELLESFAAELKTEVEKHGKETLLLKKIDDWFSNSLQASEYKACITASPHHEADELARMYLESQRRAPARETSIRQMILRQMRREFELAGVWRAMYPIVAEKYTHPGDPLKIDCAYAPRGQAMVKMFHATPLHTDVNAAKALAFTFPQLAEGLKKKEKLDSELTAIAEDESANSDQTIAFAREILEQQGIRIAPLQEMPQIAAQAAREIAS